VIITPPAYEAFNEQAQARGEIEHVRVLRDELRYLREHLLVHIEMA
jgi:hypothetical protein